TIIKNESRVHGLTTAAVIWVAAAVGTLAGLGLLKFAAVVAVIVSGILYILRKLDIQDSIDPPHTAKQLH
ncbi:MAG: MgtC/SapB family protein, partial [Candidatus Liptonbacteria bacterium]